MSNTRKPKNNAAKIEIAKPEPTKTAALKPAAVKSAPAAPAAAKPVTGQSAAASHPPTPAISSKPSSAPSPATPSPVAVQPAVSKPAAPAAKPVAKSPEIPKIGHVSLELVKPGAKHVCVAGSFNEWKPEKTPLVQIGNGRWVGDLAVNPGKHEYLFVVDGQWVPDPNAKESVQNPFGGRNSILTVSA